jgi:uncharacterized OB-fold protein
MQSTENSKNMVKASYCKCRDLFVPPKKYCSKCDTEPDQISIEPRGKILTFTVVHVTTEGFDTPLGIALVELGQELKLMCNIQTDRTFKIGDVIKLKMESDRWVCEE